MILEGPPFAARGVTQFAGLETFAEPGLDAA